MDTDAVAVLVAAASAGSLSAAARRLGITPMIATRRLAALEHDLGVRLMQRTTRSLSLTPEGETFLPFAQALIEGEAAGRAMLRSSTAGASGLLRVSAPVAFSRKIIAPLVPALLRANPALRIDLDLTDHVVDIVATGIDLAIRVAPLRDNGLIARRLAPSPRYLCASPGYLEQRGAPDTLEALADHDCLALTGTTHWAFQLDGQERRVRVAGRFSASSVEGLYEAGLHGAGIMLAAEWNVRNDLRRGRLIAITIPGAAPVDLSVWAVYPTTRLVLPKLRVFVAAIEAALAPP
ncbi:MAG: LysR family transcriptional regulator [Azospirillaceae bacterium]|nr:LysR family transcriptional regulator [Azospirillaceae bacterium]